MPETISTQAKHWMSHVMRFRAFLPKSKYVDAKDTKCHVESPNSSGAREPPPQPVVSQHTARVHLCLRYSLLKKRSPRGRCELFGALPVPASSTKRASKRAIIRQEIVQLPGRSGLGRLWTFPRVELYPRTRWSHAWLRKYVRSQWCSGNFTVFANRSNCATRNDYETIKPNVQLRVSWITWMPSSA